MSLPFQIAIILLAVDPAPPIVALAVAPDGKSIVAASQAGVEIRSLPDLEVERTLATKLEHIHDLAFSPGGETLAIAGGSPGERGGVELRSWPAGKLRLELPAGDDLAYRLAWDADGLRLAIAGADKAVRVQPAKGGPPRVLRPHSAAVLAVAWLPVDDLILSAGVDHTIRLLHPFSGATIRSFENHTGPVRDLAVRPGSHDGPVTVASASADRTVRFWQPTIGRLVRFARLPAAPTAIGWTVDGSHVLAACEDGKLRAVHPVTVAVTEFAAQLDGWAYAVVALPRSREALLSGERGRVRRISLDGIQP